MLLLLMTLFLSKLSNKIVGNDFTTEGSDIYVELLGFIFPSVKMSHQMEAQKWVSFFCFSCGTKFFKSLLIKMGKSSLPKMLHNKADFPFTFFNFDFLRPNNTFIIYKGGGRRRLTQKSKSCNSRILVFVPYINSLVFSNPFILLRVENLG